jgi:RNA polymerase-binding transcription factor DksA
LGRQLHRAATRPPGEGMDLAEHRRRPEQRRNELLGRAARIGEPLLCADDTREPDFAEQAAVREGNEVDEALGAATDEELLAIDPALNRMQNGTDGRCLARAAPIERGRLTAPPAAERGAHCARWRGRTRAPSAFERHHGIHDLVRRVRRAVPD